MKMERKTFPGLWKNVVDADQGIVEHIVTVFGIVDLGGDISHKGSFKKTLQEREKNVRVLDSHNTDSIMAAVGVPLEIREVGREELPQAILSQFPEATGGVKARTQYLMDTPEGKGAFARIKAGAIDEYSYGYDAVDVDWSEVPTKDGNRKVRNLRQIRLWEYSPVLWGMNPATMTTDVKGAGENAEEDAEPDEAHVVDCECPDCKETDPEAEQTEAEQVEEKEMIDGAPHIRLGDYLQGRLHGSYTRCVDELYATGHMSKEERIQMSAAISAGLNALEAAMPMNVANLDLTQIYGQEAAYYMAAGGPVEGKVGRAISGANGARIQAALAALAEVLNEAGIGFGFIEEEDEEGVEKAIAEADTPKKAESEEDSPKLAGEAEAKGADSVTPNIDMERFLLEIEVELNELDIMGV